MPTNNKEYIYSDARRLVPNLLLTDDLLQNGCPKRLQNWYVRLSALPMLLGVL